MVRNTKKSGHTVFAAVFGRQAVLRLSVLVALCLISGIVSVSGQAAGDSYRLPGGSTVAGGGEATSENYALAGTAVLGGGGTISAGPLLLYGGLQAASFGQGGVFRAHFSSSQVDTVAAMDRTIRVAFGGGRGETSGRIMYRLGGQAEFSTASMPLSTGDTLIYSVSDTLLTLRSLEFCFETVRGIDTLNLGTQESPYVFVAYLDNTAARRPIAMPETRYRIVGLPIGVDGSNSVENVFEDDLGPADKTSWRLGRYDNRNDLVTEFPDIDDVIPGRGYWLITRDAQTYGADGYSVRPNRVHEGVGYYEVALESGWNQVANPFPFDLDWRDLLFDDNGIVIGHDTTVIVDDAYWYTGVGYFLANTLLSWDGFFIFTKKPGLKMLFPYQEKLWQAGRIRPTSIATSGPPAAWRIHLQLTSQSLTDEGNFIGVHENASEGVDGFDYPEPPAPPGAPRLAFRLPDNDRYLRRTDIRPPFDGGAAWDIDITGSPARKLVVSGVAELPDDLEAVLILDVGTTIPVTDGLVIDLPEDTRTARLIIGDPDYTAEEIASLLPESFALYQNFPNPFNPVTNIRFALPEGTHVLLEVYNLLGQRVTTLVDRQMGAGTHTVEWNGMDHNQRQVATGIYFYRITADEYTEVKKMVLLK